MYDYIVGSWAGMTSDVLMVISAVIGIIRHDVNNGGCEEIEENSTIISPNTTNVYNE